MTLAINTSATATSTTTSCAASITTTAANCWIVVTIKATQTATITVADSDSLTWTKITGASGAWGGNGTGGSFATYYALLATAGSTTITASFSTSVSSRIEVVAVSGANTTTPFDTNTSLPQLINGTAVTTLSTSAITTNAANTLLLLNMNNDTGMGTITRPSGFTAVNSTGTAMDCSYQVFSSALSSVTETFSYTTAGNTSVLSALAFQAAGTGSLTAGTASTTSSGNTVATVTVGAASGGTSPYSYQWYRSTTSGFTPGAGNIISGATSQTLNDTGLTNGTTYYYVNKVTDSASNTATSNQISATPSASLTSGTASTTSSGNTIATVTVGAASGGTSPYSYQWYRSTTSGFTPGAGNIISGATSQTLNDTGLTNGTTYYYVNKVTDSASNTALSNQISATPSVALVAGTLSLSSKGNTVASLSCTASSGGSGTVTHQYYRSTSPATQGSAVSGATSLTLSDTGLTNGTPYYYTVVFTDASNNTATSNQVTVVPNKTIYVGLIGDSWNTETCSASNGSSAAVSSTAAGNILQAKLQAMFQDGTVVVVNNQGVGGTGGNDWAPGGTNMNTAVAAFAAAHSTRSDWIIMVHLGINDSSVNYSTPTGGESAAQYRGYLSAIATYLTATWGAGKVILTGPPYIGAISTNHTENGVILLSQYFAQLQSIASSNSSQIFANLNQYNYFIGNQGDLGYDQVHPTPADGNGQGGATNVSTMWAKSVFSVLNPSTGTGSSKYWFWR